MAHEAGKGSGRRKEDVKKIHDNWDLIFGTKKQKEQKMNEHDDNEIDHDDSEWQCDACRGPMYRQAHWNYAQCDYCGARQELESDDY